MKSRKNSPLNFAMSIRLSVHLNITTRDPLNGFSIKLILGRWKVPKNLFSVGLYSKFICFDKFNYNRTLYIGIYVRSGAHFECNFLNIHRNKKYSEQKLWKKIKHMFYTQHTFSAHLTAFDVEELIAYFPLIGQGSHRKRRVQQFFYCCLCVSWRNTSFTEPLPSNNWGIHIQTHRWMRGIYELRRWDGLSCHDIHTKFHKDWFRHSNIDGGGGGDTQKHRQHGDLISLLLFFPSRKVG
jgi:hypothetical protein